MSLVCQCNVSDVTRISYSRYLLQFIAGYGETEAALKFCFKTCVAMKFVDDDDDDDDSVLHYKADG